MAENKKDWFLFLKQHLYSNATGGDPDKVSAFYGIENSDIDALIALRREIAWHKNQNPLEPTYSEDDYVILNIACSDI